MDRSAGGPIGETKGEDTSSPFVCRPHRTNGDDLLQAFSFHEAGETVTIRPLRRNKLLEAQVTLRERRKRTEKVRRAMDEGVPTYPNI